MTLHLSCNRCHRPIEVEFQPGDLITEEFIRKIAVCNPCADRRHPQLPDRQFQQKPEQARLPYPDP